MSVPITRDGPYPVPYAYKLAPGESWEALAISATFDGTSASGAFYPCCSIYTQDGKLVSRDFPSSSVAAGASAEVTYHPFLRTAAASTPVTSSGPSVATFYTSASVAGDTPITVGAGATVNITWAHHALPSDGSVSAFLTTFIEYNIACMCVEYLYVGWDAGNYTKAAVLGTNSRIVKADAFGVDNVSRNQNPDSFLSQDYTSQIHPNAHTISELVHAYVVNYDTVAHNVNEAWFVTYLWPALGYTGTIPGWPK